MKDDEEEKYRICWNITSKCNQNCEYCHRFMVNERKFKDNKKILKKMINDGITNITWSGGEALLYKDVIKLMKLSKEAGIQNKLITNGLIFSELEDKEKEELCENLDAIVLSIDSINENTNTELGRGKEHFETVKKVLNYLKGKKVKTNINTVLSKKSLGEMENLAQFLNNYDIDTWKFFKFMAFRGKAKENKEQFEIDNEDMEKVVQEIKKKELKNIKDIYYKTEERMEEDIVLDAQGNMYQSLRNEQGEYVDNYKGKAMTDNVVKIIKESRRKTNKNNFRNSLEVDIKQSNYYEFPQYSKGTCEKEGKEPELDE